MHTLSQKGLLHHNLCEVGKGRIQSPLYYQIMMMQVNSDLKISWVGGLVMDGQVKCITKASQICCLQNKKKVLASQIFRQQTLKQVSEVGKKFRSFFLFLFVFWFDN